MTGLWFSGTATTQGSRYDFILTINHPYAANGGTYIDQTSTYHLLSGSIYAIVSDFGGTSDTLIGKRQKGLSSSLSQGLAESSEPVRGETLNIMGLTWMKECLLTDRLLAGLAETVAIRHHRIGVVGQEAGYYIDVPTAFTSIISRHNNDADKKAHFYGSALVSSAFEHGMLEQLMGSDKPGASTMKLLHMANGLGQKVFWANSGNFTAIRSQLTNYGTSTLNDLQSQVNSGRTLVLPQDGQLELNQWTGLTYITRYESGSTMSLGLIIGGGYYGGYGGEPGTVQPEFISPLVQQNVQNLSSPGTTHIQITPLQVVTARDPVDMAGGAFLHSHTDLALGGPAPLGLAFSRSYDSSLNLEDSGLGFGWSHGYDIRLSKASNGDPGLGNRQPVDATAMIAALYVNLDLIKNQDNLTGWMAASLTNKWVLDRLINNTVTLRLGGRMMQFIKLADGAYASPAGITTKLVDNGDGTFRVEERFGARLFFDASGRITRWEDADGNAMLFTYSGDSLTTVSDAFGRSLSFSSTGGRITAVSDSTGRSVGFGYDVAGNLVTSTDVESNIWTYGYDSSHRIISLTDPLGVTTATNTYDALGRVESQALARQGGTSTVYNFYFSGFRNVEEDVLGNRTVYSYDALGRLTGEEDPLGHRSSRAYDGQWHMVSLTDPRSNTTTLTYDGNHNLMETENALSARWTNSYDSQFRLVGAADPLGQLLDYSCDAEHHPTRTRIYPASGQTVETEASYFASGLTQTVTDGRGTVTTFSHDAYGNPNASQTGSQSAVTSTHDAIGRMTALTDQMGNTTTFTHDDRGLVTSRTDPFGNTVHFTYDAAGRLVSKTDRNGQTTAYTYTPTGNIDTVSYPDSSSVAFSYDINDRLSSMTDTLGNTTYVRDAAGRVVSHTDAHGFTVGYAYDPAGNLTQMTYPGNKPVTYAYDALNRLVTVTDWQGRTATYTYDAAGRPTSLTHFNNTVTFYVVKRSSPNPGAG